MVWMAVLVVVVVGVVAWIFANAWLNREVQGEVEVRNAAGSAGRALVVYHPGRGSFHPRVVAGFVEGLIANGWRVEVATASQRAPTDLAGYDLLVVGSPTYWFTPSTPIRKYLRRLGDLNGQRTVTIVTGMGAGERSSSALQDQVRQANGDLIKALLLYRMRPNDDDNHVDVAQNKALAIEMATCAGQEMPLPGGAGSSS